MLVVGMPNIGKSTLLNALRTMGIVGRESRSPLSSDRSSSAHSLSCTSHCVNKTICPLQPPQKLYRRPLTLGRLVLCPRG